MNLQGFHLPDPRPSQTTPISTDNRRLFEYRRMEAMGVPEQIRNLVWDMHWMVDGTGGGNPTERLRANDHDPESVKLRLEMWRADVSRVIDDAVGIKRHKQIMRVTGIYKGLD